MPAPLRLEVFELPDAPDAPSLLLPEDLEELRLNAYERGYLAGWDDASAQAAREADTHRATVARQIEHLGFTYHEARAHVLSGLEPLLRAVLDTLLPVAARKALVPMVVEHLLPLAGTSASSPLRLVVAPGLRPAFESAFEGLVLPPLIIVEEPQADPLTARLEGADRETHVDLGAVIRRLGLAFDRFYQLQTEESRHG